MSLTSAQVRKIISIIRQHEVFYGGGISSLDAGFRDECEKLIEELESILPEAEAKSLHRENLWDVGNSLRLERMLKNRTKPRSKPDPKIESLVVSKKSSHSAEDEDYDEEPSQKGKLNQKKKEKPKTKAELAKEAKALEKAKALEEKERALALKSKGKNVSIVKETVKTEVKGKALPSIETPKTKVLAKSVTHIPGRREAPTETVVPGRRPESERPQVQTVRPPKDPNDKRLEAAHLFDAYKKNMLPKYGGYIVSIYNKPEERYLIIEVVGYENLQDIYPSEDSLVFKTQGCKLSAIVEQAGFVFKNVEPVHRSQGYSIPYRFKELNALVTKKYQSIYIGKNPVMHPTSFNIHRPEGEDLAVLFYDVANVFANIQDFLISVLKVKADIPIIDARKASEAIARQIQQFHNWLDQ